MEENKLNGKGKLFIFATDHALPTAFAMNEEGDVIASHAGSDYQDAVDWLRYHHETRTFKGYEIVELPENKVKAHIYKGEPLSILGEDVAAAFHKNQEKGRKAKK